MPLARSSTARPSSPSAKRPNRRPSHLDLAWSRRRPALAPRQRRRKARARSRCSGDARSRRGTGRGIEGQNEVPRGSTDPGARSKRHVTTTAPIVDNAITEARARGFGPTGVPPIARLRAGRLRSGWAASGVCRRRRHRLRRLRPTAPSLHVGHMLGMMMLASLQRFGHRPIALGGGGTALVGDPSGKTSTAGHLSEEEIRSNLEQHPAAVRALPRFRRASSSGANPPALLLNNADWLL